MTYQLSDEEVMDSIEFQKMRERASPKMTDSEWLAIFPESIEVIPEKIKEWSDRRKEIEDQLKERLKVLKSNSKNEFDYWFGKEWLKETLLEEMIEAEKHIKRLKSFLPSNKSPSYEYKLSQESIDKAKLVRIVDLISHDLHLKKHGKNYFALCPFHEERTPSFCIYPESNNFYCYGCNQSGDVIKYAMLTNNLNFKQAVKWLLERY